MVRQWQQLFFESRYSFTEMNNPDFTKIAEGFGINSHKTIDRASLEDDINKMLQTEGPYVLEVEVEKEDNVFPMVPSGDSVTNIRLD